MTNYNLPVRHKVWGDCILESAELKQVGMADVNHSVYDLYATLTLPDGQTKIVSLPTCVRNEIIDIADFSEELMDDFNTAAVQIAEAQAEAAEAMKARNEQWMIEYRERIHKQNQNKAANRKAAKKSAKKSDDEIDCEEIDEEI